MIGISHRDKILKGKLRNHITKGCANIIGAFQGIPICAQLYIIYAGHIKNKYKRDIGNNPIIGKKVIAK